MLRKSKILSIPFQEKDIKVGYEYGIMVEQIEELLVCDCYDAHSEDVDIRIVFDEKSFISYEPNLEKWSKALIKDGWKTNQKGPVNDSNIYVSEKGKKLLEKFYKNNFGESIEGLNLIYRLQREYLYIDEEKKNKKIQDNIDAHIAKVEGKYSEGFEEYVEKYMYKNTDNFMYYKNKGTKAHLKCSICGSSQTIKVGDDYGEYEKPRNGGLAWCSCCKKTLRYKAIGRAKIEHYVKFINDAIKYDESVCVKVIRIEKIIGPDIKERININEDICYFFEKDKKMIQAYSRHEYGTREKVWRKNGYYGYSGEPRGEELSPGGYQELQKSYLKYANYDSFKEKTGTWLNLERYLERYNRFPEIEMMMKKGFIKTAKRIAEGSHDYDFKAKSIADFLKIKSNRVQLFKQSDDSVTLEILRIERKNNIKMSEQDIEEIKEYARGSSTIMSDYKKIFEYAKVRKALNYMKKQKNKSIHNTLMKYRDYLDMKNKLGYDMKDEIILFPHDLTTAHNRAVVESEEYEADKRKKEVLKKFPQISKKYKKLFKEYAYAEGDYIIRPVKDAAEIISEGRIQHHCVGSSDTYLSRHNEGKSYILVMRHKEEPDMPFVTIEIENDTIRQWYEAYDKKTTEKTTQPYLDKYVKFLKTKKSKEKAS